MTRNYGINQASGKYIMFVDSDDYIETDMIKRMVTKAEKDKADLIVEGYKKVTDKKEILFVENYEKYEYTDQDVMKIFVPKMVGSLPEKKDSIFTTVCAKLYLRKTIVDNNVMFMSERNFQSEDLAFQFSVCKYIHRVEITEYSGYFYRTNPNSLTTIYKKNRFNETKKVYIFIREQLEKICSDEYQLYRADKMLYVQLRASIAQEKSSINHVGMMKSIKNIKTMMNDSVVRASIEKYPIKKLKMKQKIFLFLLKYRLAFFTECLVIAGVI